MVIKVKVSDVAKDFGKTNKEIIEILGKYCDGAAKKAGTVLEENELNILFDKITLDNSVKKLDDYFNSAKPKLKKEKEKSAAPGSALLPKHSIEFLAPARQTPAWRKIVPG